ncbi:MAG: TolB family protein [Symbiobacteriia bacterium]
MVRRTVTGLVVGAVLFVAVFWGGSTSPANTSTLLEPAALVAYIYQGDLWVGDLSGSAPRRLTQGGDSARPVWSPSSRWLLVEKESTALLVEVATGEAHRVAAESAGLAAQWAPDRDRLAFVDDRGRLKTINADGSDARQVAGPPFGGATAAPVWSPDGKWLAFAAPVKGTAGQPANGAGNGVTPAGLWRVPAGGGKPELIYQRSDGERPGVIPTAWTAGGDAVVAWSGPMVTPSIMADGLSLLVVPFAGPPRDLGFALVHRDFVAASSKGPIAATLGAGRMTWTKKRVDPFRPGAGAKEPVFATPENLATVSPAWSPSGGLLAYVAMPDLGEASGDAIRQGLMKRRLYVVAPAGKDGAAADAGAGNAAASTAPRKLNGDPRFRDESPHWVSDRQIVFARIDERGEASLWTVDVNKPAPRLVAELGPLPMDGFGYYGWIDWQRLFDVWPAGLARSRTSR